MKILMVIHDFLPIHQAGSELYCFHLGKALQQLGHDVRLFYSEIDHAAPNYSTRRGTCDGLPFLEIVNNHSFASFEETYSNPAVEAAFASWLDEFQPNAAHFHHLWNLSFGCVRLCREWGVPVVFTLHDYWLTCPRGGGQRFRGEGRLCHDVDAHLCAECISRYTFPSGLGTRLVKKILAPFERLRDPTLLSLMEKGRITAPQSDFVHRGPCIINGDAREALYAHPPARIAIRCEIPPGASLSFAVAMHPSVYNEPGDGVRFRVSCNGATLCEIILHPKQREDDRGWREAFVDLAPCGAGRRELVFETSAQPTGDNDFCTACWAEPRIVAPEGEPFHPSLTRRVQEFAENALTRLQRSRLKKMVDRRTLGVRVLFNEVDLFIAPSPFLRQKFIEYGLPPDKIEFSDYGIASEAYAAEPRVPQIPIRFLYVGTIVEHKGLHVLIDAFNRLPLASAILDVYGNLDEFTGYVKRIQAAVAHPGIRLRGRAENRDIPRILSNSDVLVIPSIWFENSPITIHEAFLARVPVITSRLGGMADLVRDGDNGLLFEVGNDNDLSRCLKRLVDDPAQIERLRPNPAEVKSIPADAQWTAAKYEELIANKNR
ncbi:MAG: glycosyltransferase [Candidatus Omnitrophota bacterium]